MKNLLYAFLVVFTLLVGWYIFTPPIAVSTDVHKVHISFDDVSKSLAEITFDSIVYPTLESHPFFAELDRLHSEYGASFSLYLYYREGNFSVEQITPRYKGEFKRRSDWLKLGFHAIQPGFDILRDANTDTLRIYYERTVKSIGHFADSTCITKRIRLNRFFATRPQLSLLDSFGVTSLLAADDNRQSYSLSRQANEDLIKNGKLMSGNIEMLRTDIRLEKTYLPELALMKHSRQDTLTIFTHEREFELINRWKLRRLLKLLSRNHPDYLN